MSATAMPDYKGQCWHLARGVVVAHPLSMRGSIASVLISFNSLAKNWEWSLLKGPKVSECKCGQGRCIPPSSWSSNQINGIDLNLNLTTYAIHLTMCRALSRQHFTKHIPRKCLVGSYGPAVQECKPQGLQTWSQNFYNESRGSQKSALLLSGAKKKCWQAII